MAFTIPTIFSAVDKISSPLKNMGQAVDKFAARAEAGISRGERMFRKLTPVLSETSKQFLSFASTAAIAGSIVAGVHYSTDQIMKYEDAVASFRTIVGGTDKEFSAYQNKINEVAKANKKSSVDTAAAFEKIAGLNAKFAETADSIGQVSSAVITLSKASGDELGASAESLVGIMNQFTLAADQSNRVINVLAAGAGVGAASIVQTSEAFVNFGSVAAGANISLEQSVGLIQTMGKFSLFGAEAGTKLRGSVLKLQQAGMGYKSGQFQINDALEEARKKIDKLRTSKEKDAAILKMFGAENIATGKILLNNISTFNEFTKGVTGTNAASEQAAIRSNTLSNSLDELKAAWVNMLTGSNAAGSGLQKVKDVVRFVANNLDQIVTVGINAIKFFALFKGALIVARTAMSAYNIALGIQGALSGVVNVAVGKSAIALKAYNATVWLAEAAQWAWNAAISANPIMLAVAATAALTVAAYGLYKVIQSTNTAQQVQNDLHERVMQKTIDQRVEVVELFGALKNLKVGSEAYNSTLQKIDAIQPGITAKYNLQQGAIQNMAAAERELTATIMKRAEAEAKAELLREAIKSKLTLQAEGPSTLQKITGAVGGPSAAFQNQMDIAKEDARINVLSKMVAQSPAEKTAENSLSATGPSKEAISTKPAEQAALLQKMEQTNNAKVELTVKDPGNRTEATSDSKFVKIKTSSTMSVK